MLGLLLLLVWFLNFFKQLFACCFSHMNPSTRPLSFPQIVVSAFHDDMKREYEATEWSMPTAKKLVRHNKTIFE